MSATITTDEAARRLGIHAASVRRLCGQIGLVRHGRDWLLTEADFRRLAKTAQPGPGNPSGKRR